MITINTVLAYSFKFSHRNPRWIYLIQFLLPPSPPPPPPPPPPPQHTHGQCIPQKNFIFHEFTETIWSPSQYTKRPLFVRSRKVSKPRDAYFELSYRLEIWQAHRQHCCRSVSQISERSDNSKYKSRGFETLRDLTERRLFGYWDGAQVTL